MFFKPHISLAIAEAKDNNHAVSDEMQQAIDYAERLLIPFVFTSNGDGFTFHNRMSQCEDKDSADRNRFKRLGVSKSAIRDKVKYAMNDEELNHIFNADGFFM